MLIYILKLCQMWTISHQTAQNTGGRGNGFLRDSGAWSPFLKGGLQETNSKPTQVWTAEDTVPQGVAPITPEISAMQKGGFS